MAGVQRRENKRSDLNSFWKVTSWEKEKQNSREGNRRKKTHINL